MVPIPKRSASPWATLNTAVVDSLKALDQNGRLEKRTLCPSRRRDG
jgi:hypothetical protein